MSWFDSVKDVAKIVAKNIAEATSSVTDSVDRYSFEPVTNVAKSVAKNIAEATSSVTDSVDRYTLSAVPDNHSGWWGGLSTSGNHNEGSSESVSDSERLDVASGFTAVEVTTRARYTYELDSTAIMPWFETVKSVAKTVVKTLSDVTGGPAIDKGSFALPYRDGRPEPSTSRMAGNESNSESDTSEEEATGVSQITTRARITYELDRFQKNALLMFVQMKSEPPGSGCRVEETTTQDINVILDTLTGFRFEVNNTHIDLTCSEIENKCQEFFQQNFTEYGAVIVVVLTFDGTTGQLSALDGRLSESIILRHLTDNLNPTLLGKPKIYITEANRIISSENGLRLISISLEGHQDVLGFHIPTTMEHQSMIRRPLLLMCDNIKNMADNHDFATILKKSAEDIAAEPNFVFVDNPIEYCNNFTKEMILARS